MEKVAGFKPFALERYFAKYEHSAPHLLCCSDCEPLKMSELLENADDECKSLWDNLVLSYTHVNGLPQLRKELCDLYNSESYDGENIWKCDADDFLILCPEEAIYLSFRALLSPGDHVVVPAPSYQSLSEIAKSIGCSVSWWVPKFNQNDNIWHFDPNDLDKLIQPNTKAVVMNFPHNPTGCLPTIDELHTIVKSCERANCYLFSDEMYRDLEMDEGQHLPSAFQLYSKAVVLGGVSKTLALPGLRIGWCVSQDKPLMKQIQTLRDYTTICPPAPSEILSLMALRNRKSILERNINIIQNGYKALSELLSQYPQHFVIPKPTAGSMVFVKLIGMNVYDFSEAMVSKYGIMLIPSTVYDLENDPNCLRFGIGRADFPEKLKIFETAIKDILQL